MTMHVGVAGWLLGPPSGANRRLLALLREIGPMLDLGERITVLHDARWHPPLSHRRIAWRQVPIPSGPTLRRSLAERAVLPRACRELAFDLFDHAMLPAPALPCPLVLTVHDVRDADGFGRRPRWFARAVLRASCRRAAAVVAPSAFTAVRLRTHVPGIAPAIVPGGVDPPATATARDADGRAPRAADGARLPLLHRDPAVLHVGHLEQRKNVAVLLRALALLPPAQRPLLHCAGADAGAGAGLRRLAGRLGVAERVRWHGAVSDVELELLFASADVVAVPSRYEGFGLPVLEALAHGRRVLAADAGALPELLPDPEALGARLLPPDDAAAWAHALAEAIGDPATGHTPQSATGDAAAAARLTHAASWSWRTGARALLEVWRAAARRPSQADAVSPSAGR